MPKIKYAYTGDAWKEASFTEGENLLTVLQREQMTIFAPCGGHGHCKKCRVIVNGEEVLACMTAASDGLEVTVPVITEEEMQRLIAEREAHHQHHHHGDQSK